MKRILNYLKNNTAEFINVTTKLVEKFISIFVLASILTFHAMVVKSQEIKTTLPFPDKPSKFEGCFDKKDYALFSVAENEGMAIFGMHKLFQTLQDGVHGMTMVYSLTKDYGYMLSSKADGKLCVVDTFTDFSFKQSGRMAEVSMPETINKEYCGFTKGYTNTCGTYHQLSRAVQSKGFTIDWQAVNGDGNVETMFSGSGKAYRLTTNTQTGATVITGNGKSEFVFTHIPTKN